MNPNKKRLRRTMMFLNAQKTGLIKDPYIYKPDSIMSFMWKGRQSLRTKPDPQCRRAAEEGAGNSGTVESGAKVMSVTQICNAVSGKIAVHIGTKAWQALLEEVYTTPKPGLVDLYSSGAHQDMDVRTFEKSAHALRPYFIRMAYQGYLLNCSYEELFRQIRRTGMAAEQAMFQATGHVNTHKGLIFTLGIYCAVAGRCAAERGQVIEEGLRIIQQRMTVRILEREIADMQEKAAVSHGEMNFQKYGAAGIRGEAIQGYRPLWEDALPVLREGIRQKKDDNAVKLQTLFALMRRIEDSNILARGGPVTLRKVREESAAFLLLFCCCAM